MSVDALATKLSSIPNYNVFGKVSAVKGLLVEAIGLSNFASIGTACEIIKKNGDKIRGEVVGFKGDKTLLMAYNSLSNVSNNDEVQLSLNNHYLHPHNSWIGRVLNAFGEPVDNKGDMLRGSQEYNLFNLPPSAFDRNRVEGKLDLGVRSINTFVTCCMGQRLGVFSGSGVGKSMLLAMFTRFAKADVKVIGLVGERGREVQEFIQDYLGEEGLKNAVVVVSTSDESALERRRAAYTVMTIAEYFRDQGKEVLVMIDSITRFAMALREIGSAAGEPPTAKGYTPTVFSELPKLLERAGPGMKDAGNITGIFSVLVEGDDNNEPVADAIRGILDGHIVLDRNIAHRGRYPAVDILQSISRSLPRCNEPWQNELINKAREYYSTYIEMAELIKIGAYKQGSDKNIDLAIKYYNTVENFLKQGPEELDDIDSAYNKLAAAIEFKVE